MVGGSSSDAEQRFATGFAGIGQSRPVCFQCLHTKEDLQRVQIRPAAIRYQYSCCITGITYIHTYICTFRTNLQFFSTDCVFFSYMQEVLIKQIHKVSLYLF